MRGGRTTTSISSPSHILLIFSSEPPRNPGNQFVPEKPSWIATENSTAVEELSKEVVNHECRLVVYDKSLNAGVIQFSINNCTAFGYFHESVFISETIEPLDKQLRLGDSLKFHGYLVNSRNKISYVISILWPLHAKIKIGFVR